MSRLALLFIISLYFSACTSTEPYQLGELETDGLATVKNATLDKLAIRPNQRFDQYKKLLIEPITITYSKQRHNSSLHRNPEDFQLDEKELEIFNRQVNKALQKQWNKSLGWQPTDKPGKDVIIVRANISDFYLFASIKKDTVQPHLTLANETSTMVLNLELVDSQSGKILLRSKDKKTTGWSNSSTSTMRQVNSVIYWSDVYQAFHQWANNISNYLKKPT